MGAELRFGKLGETDAITTIRNLIRRHDLLLSFLPPAHPKFIPNRDYGQMRLLDIDLVSLWRKLRRYHIED